MKSIKVSLVTVCALSFVGAVSLLGCGEGDLGSKDTAPPPSTEEAIKKIQDNPHMPPQAKEAAISAMKAQAEAGKAMAEAAKNNPPKK